MNWTALSSLGRAEFRIIREDLSAPQVPGPKARRIGAWLDQLERLGIKRIVTAGGKYSNHLHGVAVLGRARGFETAALVRGMDEGAMGALLESCKDLGMELVGLSRKAFDAVGLGTDQPILNLMAGEAFLPMGGGGAIGEAAMRSLYLEVVAGLGRQPDWVVLAAGTGTTFRGMLKAAVEGVRWLVVAPFKEPGFLLDGLSEQEASQVRLVGAVGGKRFGVLAPEARALALDFVRETGIEVDNLYQPNLLFHLKAQAEAGLFGENEVVAVLHCGGAWMNRLTAS